MSRRFSIDAGELAVLLGADTGANPAVHLLHALAAYLTTAPAPDPTVVVSGPATA